MPRKQLQQPSDSNDPLQLTCSRIEALKKINDQIEKGTRLRDESISNQEQFQERQQSFFRWDDYNRTLLIRLFNKPEIIDKYRDSVSFGMIGMTSLHEKVADLNNDISRYLNRLRSIGEQLELFPEPSSIDEKDILSSNSVPLGNSVFIVHGHSDGIKNQVARIREKLGLRVVILHEQDDKGKTIIEKFEYYADTCSFAVVLLTADDIGYLKENSNDASPRARQNVILELGYFLAKLGRNRVCALVEKSVELPSDYQGMLWKGLDDSSWEFKLAREIKAAGLPVDLNKL